MRVEKISIDPFELKYITGFESVSTVNEHGYAKITGYSNKKQRDHALELLENDIWGTVHYTDESGKKGVLFCGLVTNMNVQEENDSYLLSIELKTGTYLMDIREHIRVFQSESTSYDAMQKAFLSSYSQGEYLMLCADSSTGEMVVQYKETDWEFAKRLASGRNTVLVANERSPGEKYMFGLSGQETGKLSNYEEYEIVRELGDYRKKKENGLTGIAVSDAAAYHVNSRQVFWTGDCVLFQDKKYIVESVQRVWQKKELWNKYVLKSANGVQRVKYFNRRVIGASLTGFVTDVRKDTVKIYVSADENQNQGGQKWFAYSTIFSSPDGTGWYCMPEKGDSVQLHFPNEMENDAFVSSSVNLKSTDSTARSNPDHKSIKNKQGKEILFMPEKLVITNNKGMSITIDDNLGIIMESDKDIVMNAKRDIIVVSEEESLQMRASEKMLFKQGETRLELSEQITMKGKQVNLQ